MHPDVEPIGFLLGTWRGEGHGEYPTIESFDYGEEVRFAAVPGKPFLSYQQRTWALDDQRPLHAETGYWRPKPDGRLEGVLAHPTGLAEIEEGMVAGDVTTPGPTSIGRAPRAPPLSGRAPPAKGAPGLSRRFEPVGGDVLRYEVQLAAVGQQLQGPLTAELKRVDEA